MNPKNPSSSLILFFVWAACFVIVVAGIQAASELLNSFFLALIITINIVPFLQWLLRKGIPPTLALLIAILAILGLGIALIGFMGVSIAEFLHLLPSYETKIDALKDSLENILNAKGINSASIFSLDALNTQNILKWITLLVSTLGKVLSSSLLLLFIVAFMLIESTGFTGKLEKALPTNSPILARFVDYTLNIRTYMLITAGTGALAAFGDYLVLVFFQIDLAPLWGIMFFLLSFIPGVGFLIAIIPPVLLGLLKFGGSTAFLVFLGCVVIDNIVDKAIKPRFMQSGLDLSILSIFLSVIFWTWVLGPMGALLSVPLTMMVKKILLESSEEGRSLAILLGSGITKD